MKEEVFERRAADMRRRYSGETKVAAIENDQEPNHTMAEAACMLGVSRSTALRIFKNEPGVLRYSTTNGNEIVYPGKPLKRYQRVRMSYVIPESVLMRVKNRLGGIAA